MAAGAAAGSGDLAPAEVFGDPAGAPRKPRRDDRFEAAVEALDERGAGSGAIGPYRVRFLRGLDGEPPLPGDRVLARVQRRRGERLEAQVLTRLVSSPDRVPARCAHTRDCGGCSFQELDYPRQLAHKRALARRQLAPLIDAGAPEPGPVAPCEPPWAYRNKMDFTIANRRWRERGAGDGTVSSEDGGGAETFAIGLHARGRHDKVLDLRQCEIAFPGAVALVESVRLLALRHGLTAWDPLEHTGFLRHLVLRRAASTGELLVFLLTARADAPGFEALWRGLLERHPDVHTLVQGITARVSSVAQADEERVLFGPGHVTEHLGGLTLRISAGSFFQTNTRQAEHMLQQVRAWIAARPRPRGQLFDLYCGGGALGLALADLFNGLVGLELTPSAVADARANAAANDIGGARFFAGDVPGLLDQGEALRLGAAGAVLLDPPRAGLHPKLPPRLVDLSAPLLVYVSCNLASAARDLGALSEGYSVVECALVDLFPHTPHLEGLFLLERRP